MKSRPILFSAPMVRALLAGSKTQTRRVFKGTTEFKGPYNPAYLEMHKGHKGWASICPYGQPGDRLWVRETFSDDWVDLGHPVQYRADGEMDSEMWAAGVRWRPSIHMARKYCRIELEITGVRVERLNDISVEDCRAEGIEFRVEVPTRQQFQRLWESINGEKSWADNPWVWVIEFKNLGKTQEVAQDKWNNRP